MRGVGGLKWGQGQHDRRQAAGAWQAGKEAPGSGLGWVRWGDGHVSSCSWPQLCLYCAPLPARRLLWRRSEGALRLPPPAPQRETERVTVGLQ